MRFFDQKHPKTKKKSFFFTVMTSRLPKKAGKMLGLSETPPILKTSSSNNTFVSMFKNRSHEMLPGKDGEAVDKDLALYLREHEGLVKDIDGIRKDFLAIVESAERMFRYEYYNSFFFF